MTQEDNLTIRLAVVEKLTKLFRLERFVYVGASGLALVMLFINALLLIIERKAGAAELTLLFGSTGLIGISISRLLYMWKVAMQILIPLTDDREKHDGK